MTWFEWEAYLTWVTGVLLLVTAYYLDAPANLIDPGVLALAPWQAIAISVASIAAGWFAYDGLCRLLAARHPTLLAALVFVLILGQR